jgi:E3 ubiquitin-protein ligase BRE1
MKRALAERAKQSAALPASGGLLHVQAPVGAPRPELGQESHSLSPEDHGRPLKIPRRSGEVPETTTSMASQSSGASSLTLPLNATSAGGSAPLPSPRGAAETSTSPSANSRNAPSSNASMKRQRPSSQTKPQQRAPSPSEDNEDSQQFSSFFLKHQNKALASELKALQYQLSLMEAERDYRRKQCRIACQALNSLQATWTQMETELNQPRHSPSADPGSMRNAASYVEPDGPMSTGKGPRVEIVGALFDALAALASTVPSVPKIGDSGEDEDESRPNANASADLDPLEKQQLDDLSNISWNVLQRANTLEQWISSLLQRVAAPPDNGDQYQSSVSPEQRAMSKELGVLRGQCREYQIQIAELAKARDDTAMSERKVRRSIYRLATGRVKIEQVLKDMEKSDEDGTLAAEAKMEALVEEKGPSPAPAKDSNDAGAEETKVKQEPGTVDASELNHLRKQLEDLEHQLSSREANIEEVRISNVFHSLFAFFSS